MKFSCCFLPFLLAAITMVAAETDKEEQDNVQKGNLRNLQDVQQYDGIGIDDAGIIGGTVVTSATKYPYYGQFRFCGGTLVHDDIFLTAAWCIGDISTKVEDLANIPVRFLSTKLGPPASNAGANVGFTRKIIGFVRHPDFNVAEAANTNAAPYTGKNDFALIKLESSAVTGGAKLVDLSRYGNEPEPGQRVTIMGFGYTTSGANQVVSEDLREGKVTIGTDEQCRAVIPQYTSELTCYIGTGTSQGGCDGNDFGAPMIDDSTGFQVGVFGESGRDANGRCTANFGYYARNPLQKYVNWIDESVCRLTSIPRDRCQSFTTRKPTPAPTTPAQNTLITYKYNVNTVIGFNDNAKAIAPTSGDITGFLRLTEIFYKRILAETYALPYQDGTIASTPVTFVVTSVLQKTAVFDGTVSVAYQTTVVVRKYPGVPTAAQVETVLEFFDKSDFLNNFIKPATSFWNGATSVATAAVDIPPPGTIPGQV